MFSHAGTLTFSYESSERASVVAASVEREVGEIDDERSRTTLELADRRLTITVEARDLVALRAALNTWNGLVSVAERTTALAQTARNP